MQILALDSATEACSAALWRDGSVVAARYEAMRRGHAEVLMGLVRDVMRRGAAAFTDLDCIATTVGPGGFTGLRIGLASARGIALAAALPVVGVTTLAAVAAAQGGRAEPVLVALDSKRADVYAQLFDCTTSEVTPRGDPVAVAPENLAALLPEGPVAVAGNAAQTVCRALAARLPPPRPTGGPALPDAAVVACLAAVQWRDAPPSADAAPPAPLYLRPPDAALPATRCR